MRAAALGLAAALLSQVAQGGYPFKFTAGWYRVSSGDDAADLNLRHGSDYGNAWFGYYRSREESQWRAGWDRLFAASGLRFLPSLQVASQRFAGASVQVEAGEPWFIGAGLGRTNLRPYVNLNFDPNDAWLAAVGRRTANGQVAMQLIRDNREHPDQRHLHLIYRTQVRDSDRLTCDVLYKNGLVDSERIRRWGFSVTYDWPRYFLRAAWDPKVNFTPDDMWRIAAGARF